MGGGFGRLAPERICLHVFAIFPFLGVCFLHFRFFEPCSIISRFLKHFQDIWGVFLTGSPFILRVSIVQRGVRQASLGEPRFSGGASRAKLLIAWLARTWLEYQPFASA